MSPIFSKENIPNTALKWLELILRERFGLSIKLRKKLNSIILTIDGEIDLQIEIIINVSFYSNSIFSCAKWDAQAEGWESILETPLPAPCLTKYTSASLIERKVNGFTLHYDILGLVFWMLSRKEEVGRFDLDRHERFPASSSHAVKHGYLERPIVDEWLYILGQVIQRAWPQLRLKRNHFAIKVSHDVDVPSRYGFTSAKKLIRTIAGDIIKRHDFKNAAIAPWIYLNTKQTLHLADPFNTFDWIMDESEKHNLTSAFYFICGRTDKEKDADYELEHPAIRNLIKHIYKRGHEIGLHPSYNSYQSPQIIQDEAQRLKRVCFEEGVRQDKWGGRMHYLRWEHPATLQAWEQANLSYDSTLSYADRPGFRCGTCFEYPAFDPIENKMLNLRIQPLIAMECTIIAKQYMGLGYTQQALDTFLSLKESCKKVNGTFTLLWHNSHLTHEQDKQFYRAIIK